MTYRVAKRFKFSAAHCLTGLPQGDPCGRIHGHTWVAEIVISAESIENGMVVHFDEIRNTVGKFIEANLDHRNLNDLISLPTTERVAKMIFDFAVDHFGDKLERVRVEEGPNNWAEACR